MSGDAAIVPDADEQDADADLKRRKGAEYTRRSRRRRELLEQGFKILDGVPSHPEAMRKLVAAGIVQPWALDSEETYATVLGKLPELCAEPRVMKAIIAAMDDLASQLFSDFADTSQEPETASDSYTRLLP